MKKKKGRTCLVLGAGGFLGSHAVESLLSAGYAVRAFVRPRAPLANLEPWRKELTLLEGDLARPRDLERALRGADHVLHFAYSTIPENATKNPVFDLDTNVRSFLLLLEILRKTKRAGKLIYSSTGGTVYGPAKKLPIAEDHPTLPISAYGVSKLACERYLWLYHHLYGLDYLVFRFSNPYGPRQNPANAQGAVTHFLRRALEGKPIEIWGDGSVVRDYFYVRDLLPLFPRALASARTGETFNVGKGEGHSLNQIARVIGRVLETAPRVKHSSGRKIDVPVNVLNVKKVERALGWRAKTGLEEGIRATRDWLLDQGKD